MALKLKKLYHLNGHCIMRSLLLLSSLFLVAADWPRFRGPNGTGITDATPTRWTSTENFLWKVELPGKGNGSPIVVKGKIFLQSAATDGTNRSLICLDAVTGKEVWTKTHIGSHARTHKKSSLASSTPASDGERVYVCFWDGSNVSLLAYDFTGKELWSKPLGKFVGEHGAGMSPVVHDGRVFVNFDIDKSAEMVAFDAKTGNKAWNQPRKAYRTCYSTPMVREIPGGSEIIDLSTAGLTAYDPATGKVNWESTFTWGPKPLRSVASPVAIGELIIVVTGDGAGDRFCAGIKPGRDTSIVWSNKSNKLAPYVPCPITVGKHLFWITDHGVLECINPLTGKAVWSTTVFNGTVTASPILMGDALLLIDEKGNAVTCKAEASGYKLINKSTVGEGVFATPAAADGKLYIRGATSLLCIGT